MRSRELDEVRRNLHRRRRRLVGTALGAEAELAALRSAERDPEFEEAATSEHEASRLEQMGEAERRELARIDAAIARVDAGEYGRCLECGEPIDRRRLAAVPETPFCADCARRREDGARQPG